MNVGRVPAEHLLIADVDDLSREAELHELLERLGLPLDTMRVRTRRGWHYYFDLSHLRLSGEQVGGKIIVGGVEFLKGRSCYVVAPPSVVRRHEYAVVG